MSTKSAESIANPIFTFIKYWGDKNFQLKITANGSISMNFDNLFTRTSVIFFQRLHLMNFVWKVKSSVMYHTSG